MTLKEMARLLGVSASTISRVLNASPEEDSPWASRETQQRIFELAASSGYTKNPFAASLRTSRTHLIGVMVPRLQDYVLATIYEGIDEAAIERGYFTVVANSLDVPENHRRRAEELLDRRVDGLIFGDAMIKDVVLDALSARGVRFVLVNRRSPGYPSSTCDDYSGGRSAADHLLSRGMTRFAMIAGNKSASTTIDRTAGFRDRLAEADIHLDDDLVVHGGFDAAAGRAGAQQILERATTLPDAIFAANDFAAIGAMGTLREAGLTVPDDVALLGYNDTPLADAVGLTTIRSPMREIGRTGVHLLLQVLDGKKPESVLHTPELIVRATT